MKVAETSGNIVTNPVQRYENPFSKAEKNLKDQEKLNHFRDQEKLINLKEQEKLLCPLKDQGKSIDKLRDKTHMKPLTQKFFTDMLSLEIEMANRAFKFSTIEQLVQLYAVRYLIERERETLKILCRKQLNTMTH